MISGVRDESRHSFFHEIDGCVVVEIVDETIDCLILDDGIVAAYHAGIVSFCNER